VPRATRLPLPIPIMYRPTSEDTRFQSTIVNLSESGVLFGPAELQPGAEVEVILSPLIQVGSMATGNRHAWRRWCARPTEAQRRHALKSAGFS
jgi:hypothetical protein